MKNVIIGLLISGFSFAGDLVITKPNNTSSGIVVAVFGKPAEDIFNQLTLSKERSTSVPGGGVGTERVGRSVVCGRSDSGNGVVEFVCEFEIQNDGRVKRNAADPIPSP